MVRNKMDQRLSCWDPISLSILFLNRRADFSGIREAQQRAAAERGKQMESMVHSKLEQHAVCRDLVSEQVTVDLQG